MSRLFPLLAFLVLGGLLAFGLQNAATKGDLPSPLIGKPVPAFSLPSLDNPDEVFTPESFAGQPYLLNFWASWCVTCRVEHPLITKLAESGALKVVGMNFRDEKVDAVAWLARFGDPYAVNLQDLDGRTSIDFGVYAAPESFLVDANGTVVYKQLGAITEEAIMTEILPRVRESAAMAGNTP
jgi:cytochrome c biogenesis protein CcmG/thiol:disulfide interchange protein DsbE